MTDATTTTDPIDETTPVEQPEADEATEADETDYKALYEKAKAESRKWERQSKKNFEKAKKFDELTAGEQTVEDRIAALEADKKRLENEKARAELVKAVSQETGVPEAIVSHLSATDEYELTAQAQEIAENYKIPAGAPTAPEAGKFPRDAGNGKSNAQRFGEAFDAILGR